MTHSRILYFVAVLAGSVLIGAPLGRAAGPPTALADTQLGVWHLIPLENSKVPAAWVLNTATGDLYLCGTGALNGRARVACIEADFPRAHAK